MCGGVGWNGVSDVLDVVARGRMELGVVGYMGWEGCDESVEESDVAVAMGGSMVAHAFVGGVGGRESSSWSKSVATRWSLMYRSAWSSMSEFQYDDGGCPGPEAREYVES